MFRTPHVLTLAAALLGAAALSPAAAQTLPDLDLVVVPSLWYENTPFSVLEARAMGVPVVASDLGGISEVIVPGQDGFLFRAGDQDALAGVLGGILDDPEQLRAMTCGGGRTLADNAAEFVALYAELLSSW